MLDCDSDLDDKSVNKSDTKVTQSWDMTTHIPLPLDMQQRFSSGIIVADFSIS